MRSIEHKDFTFRPRHAALGGAFLCALIAASLAIGTTGNPPSAPARSSDGTQQPVTQAIDKRLAAERNWTEKMRRAPIEVEPGPALFGSKSWGPPPPSAAKAAPTMPAFPYHYMGKLVLDGGATTLYLTKGNEVYTLKAGDVIEGSYRVELLGADHLEVTYLPLNKKQSVAFSSILPPARADASRMSGAARAPVTLAQVTNPPAPPGGHVHTHAAPSAGDARGAAAPSSSSASTQTAASVAQPVSATPAVTTPGTSSSGVVTGNLGSMRVTPPATSQMPMFPPSGNPMPILPPGPPMPMTLPTPGASMPMLPPGTVSPPQ